MNLNRRSLVMGAVSFLALPRPTWAKDQRTLLVIELAGGNDGLNAFIPYTDPNYRRLRPKLAIQDSIAISSTVGLHPALKDLKPVFESGRLALIQNVGYPNPDLSHFRSKEIWQSGRPQGSVAEGWLARYLEGQGAKAMDAVFLGEEYPLALMGDTTRYLQLSPNLALKTGGKVGNAIQSLYKTPQTLPMAERVRRTVLESNKAIQELSQDLQQRTGQNQYLQGPYGQIFALVGRILETQPQVLYLTIGGWDTHANQAQTQQRLLGLLGQGLAAIDRDVQRQGLANNVLTLVWSEFGRRPLENGSGTDHGTCGPVLVMGPVKGGFYGGQPHLDSLVQGNLPMEIDFRQIYGEILTSWLKADPKPVLGSSFPRVGFLT